jgi:hypothetical protein
MNFESGMLIWPLLIPAKNNYQRTEIMPRDVMLTIIATSLSWLSASATIHCFWKFFRDPENFNAGPFPWAEPSTVFGEAGVGWRNYIYYFLVCLGIGYCIYHGAFATLQWMPNSWRAEELSLRATLSGMIAVGGSILLISEMGKRCPSVPRRR